jgi:hypothetical protein
MMLLNLVARVRQITLVTARAPKCEYLREPAPSATAKQVNLLVMIVFAASWQGIANFS